MNQLPPSPQHQSTASESASELGCWMALAHVEGIYTRRKGEILDKLQSLGQGQAESPMEAFFTDGPEGWRAKYGLTDDEVRIITEAKQRIPELTQIASRTIQQGYELTTLFSVNYPIVLKQNLRHSSPILLYSKGDRKLLQKPMTAIVGARTASQISLDFTTNIARQAVQNQRVVVSGYARGVDRQALTAALDAGGSSVIVLPQGIATFGPKYNALRTWIEQGRVTVMSYFFPMAPWATWSALSRNHVIYGMADDIYVAESNSTGGTYSGATHGLRRGRRIYVRQPNNSEKNANQQLIEMGAIPVDIDGKPLASGQMSFLAISRKL